MAPSDARARNSAALMDGPADIEERQRLRSILERHGKEIERRWLERVRRDIVQRPGVELTDLQRPNWLERHLHTVAG